MRESRGTKTMFAQTISVPRSKFGSFLRSDPYNNNNNEDDEQFSVRNSSASTTSTQGGYYDDENRLSVESSPWNQSAAASPWNQSAAASPWNQSAAVSPWNQPYTSPFHKSPWSKFAAVTPLNDSDDCNHGLIGSLVREDGNIYSLAAFGDLLYTGSDSKNIRVWKNQKEYTGFKSNSGLVKAIIIAGEKIFTGHQDGKIRVWKVSAKNPRLHKRVGTLPKLKHIVKGSMNPSNYVEVRRHKNTIWIKHFDAISCLSLNEDQTLLYSGSWDKTLKVWRVSDFKCLESINAHNDAVNSVVAGFDGMVFTGSADGTVKVWRRKLQGKHTKHFFVQTLLKQECAVTALAVNPASSVVYCGSSDGMVHYWEREKQLTESGTLKGHRQAVLCLATAGNLVFSGSADKTICMWVRENGIHMCLSILNGHSGPVKCLTVGKDSVGTAKDERQWIVYSGSLDKSVKVWRVSEHPSELQHLQTQNQQTQIKEEEQQQMYGVLSPSADSVHSSRFSFSSSSNHARY
ncbi:hypothetical protein MKW98_025537 [Papaver atlanticum]|uniref:Uncharacterized protein n=1 Tax=Papaver atlanticum TaxID=357466 RepID=A0AAD4SBQ1_9MAGN|nr:hypothetical protein MKW98_025537 [Papaver atlanticum]